MSNVRIQDIVTRAKRQRLLGNDLFNRCAVESSRAKVTIHDLQKRSCQLNNEWGTQYTVDDIIELCGLSSKYHKPQPNLCCYCMTDQSASLLRLQPCQHLAHAQCVRQFHEDRKKEAIDIYGNETPINDVICPVCHEQLHATVEDLYAHTVAPVEFRPVRKIKRKSFWDDEDEGIDMMTDVSELQTSKRFRF